MASTRSVAGCGRLLDGSSRGTRASPAQRGVGAPHCSCTGRHCYSTCAGGAAPLIRGAILLSHLVIRIHIFEFLGPGNVWIHRCVQDPTRYFKPKLKPCTDSTISNVVN